MDWINKIFSLKKFPGQLVFIIWVSSMFIMLLPQSALEQLEVTEFKKEYGKYIGVIFIVSSAISLFMLGEFLFNRRNSKKKAKKREQKIESLLDNLTHSEVLVLREFVIQSKSTILAPYNDVSVISLENKGIIHKATRSATVNILDMGFPYQLDEYVHEILNEEHLDFPASIDNITEAQKKKILSERPRWAINIESNRKMMDDLFKL